MKKILILTILILSQFALAQRDTIINKGIYKVLYSQSLRNPLKVSYVLTKQDHRCDRDGLSFYKEPGIVTSSNQDYVGNDYDKGHMAPAESFSQNCENIKKTFSYLNCSVQHYKLNRGAWKILELKERQWSDSIKVTVNIEVIFDKKPKRTSGGAAIPSFYKKTVSFGNGKKRYVFKFPNAECTNNIFDYLVK